tara:strand:- start:700 stop:1179 length:480 start_codon:yes stop_codon:yes gene_type:complete
MNWKDTLRKAPPFYTDDAGQAQPTADTHPEIKEMFKQGIENIKQRLDNQDMNYGEKITQLTQQINELKSQKYKDWLLIRPFYNRMIKGLEQQILQLNDQIQQRGLRDTNERKYLSWDLQNLEDRKWLEEADAQFNQSINDMMVELDKETEGTEFQQGKV